MTSAAGQYRVGEGTHPCAIHPTQLAYVKCVRCGAWACQYCLAETDTGVDLCATCAAREEGEGTIAWERRGIALASRFWRTTRDVLTKTERTFTDLKPGSLSSALSYAAVVYALTNLAVVALLAPFVLLVLLGWQAPIPTPSFTGFGILLVVGMCASPLVSAASGVVAALVLGGVYHAGVALVGGKGDIVTSIRVASYGLAVTIIWSLLAIAQCIPVIGLVVMGIGFLIQCVWGAGVLTTAARTHHGLSGWRARFAGWLPAALAIAVVIGWALLTWIVSEASDAPPAVYQ